MDNATLATSGSLAKVPSEHSFLLDNTLVSFSGSHSSQRHDGIFQKDNAIYIKKELFECSECDFDIDETEAGPGNTQGVRRDLKPRVVLMLALGATIGTGVFFGVGTSLRLAGPAISLMIYVFVGTVIYSVVQLLGEMCTLIPTVSFSIYSTRFLSPAIGFAGGWMYYWNWVLTFPIEIAIVAQVVVYWTDAVPSAVWISIVWFALTVSNLLPVRIYGEIEFWISIVKVCALVGWLLYAFCMVCGASSKGPIGFSYWVLPGAWGPGHSPEDRILGFVFALINATFTYQGTELIGVTAGETKNPRKSIPKAITNVFIRICLFYVLSVFFVGMLVPYNDPGLFHNKQYSSFSPFMIAVKNCGTPVLPHIVNAVILISVVSAGNSTIYTALRVLLSLSLSNHAPKFFGVTNTAGVPYVAVLFSSFFGVLAYTTIWTKSSQALSLLINITSVAGVSAWLLISICHIRFMKALRLRRISRDSLPFKARFMPYGAYYSTVVLSIFMVVQGYSAFQDGFSWVSLMCCYLSVVLFFACWLGYQIYNHTPVLVPLDELDIDTNRVEVDRMVWASNEKRSWLYKVVHWFV